MMASYIKVNLTIFLLIVVVLITLLLISPVEKEFDFCDKCGREREFYIIMYITPEEKIIKEGAPLCRHEYVDRQGRTEMTLLQFFMHKIGL